MAAEAPQPMAVTPSAKPPRAILSSPVFRLHNGSFTSCNTPPPARARLSCTVASPTPPAQTPTKTRINGADLEQINASLAQFRTCQPSNEHMTRLSDSMGPDSDAHQAFLQSLKRVQNVLMNVQFGASGITSARVSSEGPSTYSAGLRHHPEVEICLFVDGNLDPGNLSAPLDALAKALEPLCSGRHGKGWLGGDGSESELGGGQPTEDSAPAVSASLAEVRRSRVRCRIDGVDIHVHLAPNLAADGLEGEELIAAQREIALTLPAPTTQTERDVFRAALQETSLSFLVGRGTTAHAMIRLALLWRAVNLLPRRIKAPAYLFELLGLMAYQVAARRTPGQQPPLQRCYQDFLSMLMGYKTLEIRWGAYYDLGAVPPGTSTQRPLVLDPGCPHNNVANLLAKDGWRAVKRIAQACEAALQLGTRTGAASLVDAIRAQEFYR